MERISIAVVDGIAKRVAVICTQRGYGVEFSHSKTSPSIYVYAFRPGFPRIVIRVSDHKSGIRKREPDFNWYGQTAVSEVLKMLNKAITAEIQKRERRRPVYRRGKRMRYGKHHDWE